MFTNNTTKIQKIIPTCCGVIRQSFATKEHARINRIRRSTRFIEIAWSTLVTMKYIVITIQEKSPYEFIHNKIKQDMIQKNMRTCCGVICPSFATRGNHRINRIRQKHMIHRIFWSILVTMKSIVMTFQGQKKQSLLIK